LFLAKGGSLFCGASGIQVSRPRIKNFFAARSALFSLSESHFDSLNSVSSAAFDARCLGAPHPRRAFRGERAEILLRLRRVALQSSPEPHMPASGNTLNEYILGGCHDPELHAFPHTGSYETKLS
jgi:hypothetical protein